MYDQRLHFTDNRSKKKKLKEILQMTLSNFTNRKILPTLSNRFQTFFLLQDFKNKNVFKISTSDIQIVMTREKSTAHQNL